MSFSFPEAPAFAILSDAIVTPNGVQAGGLIVEDGSIAAIVPSAQLPTALPKIPVGKRVVMPGLIDPHVHLNEPGRTHWEGFASGTQAAAAGGITTLVDMPLNSSPVTTTPQALQAKIAAAQGQLWVDCALHAGLTPHSLPHIEELAAAGVVAFKAFMVHSGIDEFPAAERQTLAAAMPRLAALGLPLFVHAELGSGPPAALATLTAEPSRYAAYLATRPPEMEVAAIRLLLELVAQSGCRVHIVHVASREAAALIQQAKMDGLPLSAETAPHYLTFAAEEIAAGDTRFKCAPPIREQAQREALWEALEAGTLDFVATDHSPSPPEGKALESGSFSEAWGGISSLQLLLPATWSAARQRGVALEQLSRWLSQRAADLLGFTERGRLEPGARADLVIWDPEAEFVVDPTQLFHRHPLTPYAGRRLHGVVEATLLAGRVVYQRGAAFGQPEGQLVWRTGEKEGV